MRRSPFFMSLAGLLVAGASLVAQPSIPNSTPVGIRGLWVLRASLASPAKIQGMVAAAKAAGFNSILVQVRGRAEALYRSRLEPRAAELDGQPVSFDPLDLTIALAHRSGLRVEAWVSVDLVASAASLPQSAAHIVWRHPEWLMVPRTLAPTLDRTSPRSPAYVAALAGWTRGQSDRVEGLYLSPIPAAARTYTVGVIDEIVRRYDVDGLHLDYARYPNDEFDYSAASLAEFRASRLSAVPPTLRRELDRKAASDRLIWTRMFPNAWADFRRDRLTMLIDRIAGDARSIRRHIVISAAVAPDPVTARTVRLQDWSLWASRGLLDVVCPMAYAATPAAFASALDSARAGAGRVPVWAGIGAYLFEPPTAREEVRAARRAGAEGVLVFSYDSIATGANARSGYLAALRPSLVADADSPASR